MPRKKKLDLIEGEPNSLVEPNSTEINPIIQFEKPKKPLPPKKAIKVAAVVKEVVQSKAIKPLDFEQYIGHKDQEMFLWLALHLLKIDPATELKNSLVQYTQLVGNEEKLAEYVEFSNKLVEALNRDEKTLLPNLAKFLYSTDIQFDKIEDCTLILSRRSDLAVDIVEALEEFKEKCLRLE